MREYESFTQKLSVETEAGKINVTANGPDTLYLDANADGARLLIRGVAYSTSAHMTKRGDAWELTNDSSLYMSRSIYSGKWNQPVSDSAKRKALEFFTQAAREFEKIKPEALGVAAEQSRNNDLAYVADDLKKVIESIGKAMARLNELGAGDKSAELRKVQLDLDTIKNNL